ncbi:hypothetical protein SEA_SIXAMA_114 [Gordonia phage Sixama]|uniref:Uncharacterized protein n=1 Tax=Gordonia phage Sixama TaxID=2653271 RepID=A0A5Q2F6E1_9CAUD|nr:hypothetical protein PP302_gp114 [Gordonia phage Sixama]QGF20293.1 hypothetical protein SEA_SIXAMA_114 [Gordonia phage Sixama]
MATKEKKKITATAEQIQQAYRLAIGRKNQQHWAGEANDARQEVIDSVFSQDSYDLVAVDDKGRTVFETIESVTKGAIDWEYLAEDNPDLDLDKYRKPAKTSITVRTGGMIDAIAEEVTSEEESQSED